MKRSPCDECREHKRRCTYDVLCMRCKRLQLKCVYTVINSPHDEEYVKEMTILKHVEQLDEELDAMEATVKHLLNVAGQPCATKSSKTLMQNDWMLATLDRSSIDSTPWELRVSNGQLAIRTFIKTHDQLLASLQPMMATVAFREAIPLTPNSLSTVDPAIEVIRNLIWARYGKSRFKTLAKDLPRPSNWIHQGKTITEHTITTQHQTRFDVISSKILHAFLTCSQYRYLPVHAPTFLVMASPQLHTSPAAMALCALSCTIQCRHIAQLVPQEHLASYARFYFDRARELVEDQFDAMTLETCTIYTLMAFYKAKVLEADEATRYVDMAERILPALKPTSSGEDAMLNRLAYTARRVRIIIHLILISKGHKSIHHFRRYPDIEVHPVKDDTEKEVRHIRLFNHLIDLRIAANKSVQLAQSGDLPTFVSTFAHMAEMAMCNWYKQLPEDFKLSLPLFDDTKSDVDYFAVVERACKADVIPLLTTIKLYNEYLIMAKIYIPKYPVIQEENAFQTSYWRHKTRKMQTLRTVVGFEGNDEEYATLLCKTVRPRSVAFSTSIAHNAITVAFNMVRLMQFLQTRASGCCYFQHRLALNVWDILMRVIRSKYQRTKIKENTEHRIRANLLLVFNMIQYQLKVIPSDAMAMEETVKHMEQELRELLSDPIKTV